jgi:cytidine deaminase
MTTDELIKAAEAVTRHRKLAGENTAGGVGAALVTVDGTVYRGVCIDTGSSMGFCAEHAAIGAMITAGESQIRAVVAVWRDERDGRLYVLPPCGRCREFMKQVDAANLDADVILAPDKVVKLRELLPYHDWPEPVVERDISAGEGKP